jgi:hypothetical protein
MNIIKVLKRGKAVKVKGELTPERKQLVESTNDVGLMELGMEAVRLFGPDVPDDIGEEITTAIENLRGTMAGYMGGQVDAAGVKAAIKEGRTRATEIRKALKTPRT